MKYSNINYKYFIIYAFICGIAMLLIRFEIFEVDGRIIAFPAVMTCYAIHFFQQKRSKQERVVNLEEYSRNENYDFIKEPCGTQLDDFKGFESLPLIMSKGEDAFMNLLVQKPSRGFDNIEKPKILTVKETISNHSGPDLHKYTQIFHFKSRKDIPPFYLADKTFLYRMEEKLSYKKIYIEKDNFPRNEYSLYGHDKNIVEFFTSDFIALLNQGVEKKKGVRVESNGKDIIFYVLYQRHTDEGMKFYTNLFHILFKALVKTS